MIRLTNHSIGRGFLFVYAVTCFLQAQALRFSLGGFDLAINRVFIVAFLLDFFVTFIRNNGKIEYFKGKYACFLFVWVAWQFVNLPFGIMNGFTGWINLTWRILIFLASAFVLFKYITSLSMFYKLLKFLQKS